MSQAWEAELKRLPDGWSLAVKAARSVDNKNYLEDILKHLTPLAVKVGCSLFALVLDTRCAVACRSRMQISRTTSACRHPSCLRFHHVVLRGTQLKRQTAKAVRRKRLLLKPTRQVGVKQLQVLRFRVAIAMQEEEEDDQEEDQEHVRFCSIKRCRCI